MNAQLLPHPTIVVLSFAGLVAGCASRVTTVSAPLSEHVVATDGVVYYLPKTYFQFTTKYDLWVETPAPAKDKNKSGDGSAAPDAGAAESDNATTGDAAAKPPTDKKPTPDETEPVRHAVFLLAATDGVKVTAVLRPDPDQRYVLKSAVGGWTEITDYKVSLTDDGYLEAVNATYEDKTADVVTNTVASVINIAKMVAKATPAKLRPFEKTSISFTFSDTVPAEVLLTGTSQTPTGDLSHVTDEIANQAASTGYSLPQINAGLKRLNSIQAGSEVPMEIKVLYPGVQFLKLESALPNVTASLAAAHGQLSPDADQVVAAMTKDKVGPGLIYRVPAAGTVQVSFDGTTAAEAPVNVYQLGTLVTKEVRSHTFSKRMEKLTFKNGALTQHEMSATSAAANATKLASDETAAIKTALGDLKTSRSTATATDIARQRDIAAKEIDLAALERQLTANQAKLDAAKTPAETEAAQAERDTLQKQKITLEAQLQALRAGVTLPTT